MPSSEDRLRELRMASRQQLHRIQRLMERQEGAERRQRETEALYAGEQVFSEALAGHPISRLMTAGGAEALAAKAAQELGHDARVIVSRQGRPGGTCLGQRGARARVLSVHERDRVPLVILHEAAHLDRRHVETPHGREFIARLMALVAWHSGSAIARVFQRALEVAEVPTAGDAYRQAIMRQALRGVA